jgi:hypothetical protein
MYKYGQNTTTGIKTDHAIQSGVVKNLYSHDISKNAILWVFEPNFYCTCRNGHNTTSGIKFDHAIRSSMAGNLYVQEILARTRF